MKLNRIQNLGAIAFGLSLLVGCGSSSPDGGDDDPVIPDPVAATLVFPEDETECNEGTVINDTQSTVTFQWNNALNTDSYTVSVTNLNTNSTSTTNSNTNEASITIQRGTPYSWSVKSIADGTNVTADSEVWRFYNEGPGVENYAPFPAEAVAPARGAYLDPVSSVTLEWNSSDLDDDISEYEVFFGTDENALPSIGTTGNTSLTNISVSSGTTYYWRVTTTDSVGNTSTSEIFEFRG